MKLRILLFPLAAGLIYLVLGGVNPPSLPAAGSPSPSGETSKRTHRPSERLSKPSLPLASEQPGAESAAGEIAELSRRIQQVLKDGPLVDHDLVFPRLLSDLVKRDPDLAARLAESAPPGQLREEMLRRVAQYWTEQDPVRAKRWAGQLPDHHERDSALTDFCLQIAQKDPQQALRMADESGLGEQPGAILENLVQQWAAKDLPEAIAWVNDRPSGGERDQMCARVAMVLAETAPAEAAQMVVDQIPAGDTQEEAVISVIYQWAKSDQSGARAWVQLFPESPLRERALNEVRGAERR